MRSFWITMAASFVLFAALCGVRSEAVAQPAKPAAAPVNVFSKEDEQAIRKTVKSIEECWNAHDMQAYSQLFREDAEFINVVGMHWRGRKAIEAAHVAFHETSFKNHNIKTDTVEIRSLGDRQAIAVVTTTNDSFKTPSGQVIPQRQNRQTYVFTKGPDGWKIAHGHNVPVDPDAAQFDPMNKPKK